MSYYEFTIEQDGRDYEVRVDLDEHPSNPRTEYDHSATQFYVVGGSRSKVYHDELDGAAGNALRHFIDQYRYTETDQIERAFHLWTIITGSPVRLVTGSDQGYSQGDWHDWFALVDTEVMAREGYGSTPEDVAKIEADEYSAYAYGDVYIVTVTGEDGDDASLGGVVDRKHYADGIMHDGTKSYVRETAEELVDEVQHAERATIEAEATAEWLTAERMFREANRAGAGFIGVI